MKELQCLILLLLMLCLTGCFARDVRIVYAGVARVPDNVSGLPRIATNTKVPVTVGEHHATIDAGGYYILSAQDLETMVHALQNKP